MSRQHTGNLPFSISHGDHHEGRKRPRFVSSVIRRRWRRAWWGPSWPAVILGARHLLTMSSVRLLQLSNSGSVACGPCEVGLGIHNISNLWIPAAHCPPAGHRLPDGGGLRLVVFGHCWGVAHTPCRACPSFPVDVHRSRASVSVRIVVEAWVHRPSCGSEAHGAVVKRPTNGDPFHRCDAAVS